MNVKKGDVLVCTGGSCELELTVTKACQQGTCSGETNFDIIASCGGDKLEIKRGEEQMRR